MYHKKKFVGTLKSNIVKSATFVLKARPALPKKGFHNAVIGEPTKETGIENDVPINRIRVPIILAEKDANGNNYVLDRLYNIGENGRSLSTLISDYYDWSGVEVAKEDIFDFDCNTAMKGNPVTVEVGYRVTGAKVTAVVAGFHPVGYTGADAA